MQEIAQRNKGLDVLRLLCSFMIVYAHNAINFDGNKYIMGLIRVAVPIFFMITGCFYKGIIKKNKEKEQILKSIKLVLFSTILYLLFYFVLYSRNGTYLQWLGNRITISNLKDLVLFNVNPFLHRLWYLNALVYVLVIAYFFNRKNRMNVLCRIALILFVCGLMLSEFSITIFGHIYHEKLYRNFLFDGLPFFCLGYFVKEKELDKKRISIFVILVLVLISLLETHILFKLDLTYEEEMFITTPFLALALFVYFNNFIVSNKITNALAFLGKTCSAKIYIIHALVEVVLEKTSVIPYNFLSVFLVSLLVAMMLNRIDSLIVKLIKK